MFLKALKGHDRVCVCVCVKSSQCLSNLHRAEELIRYILMTDCCAHFKVFSRLNKAYLAQSDKQKLKHYLQIFHPTIL